MRKRMVIGVLALGALLVAASPRPAAAGGNFFFSFGFPLPHHSVIALDASREMLQHAVRKRPQR